jgi:hypothetical protein
MLFELIQDCNKTYQNETSQLSQTIDTPKRRQTIFCYFAQKNITVYCLNVKTRRRRRSIVETEDMMILDEKKTRVSYLDPVFSL